MATDHVGYLSFDLTRLPAPVHEALVRAIAARKKDPAAAVETSVMLYAMARETWAFDALLQGRFAEDAIVYRLEIGAPELPAILQNLGLLAMQKPGLTDWRLSPASFAANPATLIGQNGCETLLPANVALQQFQFYQVIRLTDSALGLGFDAPLSEQVKLGAVHDYRLSWYPLGHSLGQIVYTLALAPGESVNLAVIDWTRRDEAERVEDSQLNEQLVHNQRRDRTITETVKAALHEYQAGSSSMGGFGVAAGGSVGILSAGLTGSVGGGSSNSRGARDLSATTVQNLSDNISQASSAMREYQSTVVVRSVQAEKESIETRTVVNYNHSHALTILYYEVLRHFRVVTELAQRRPAVLVKIRNDWFSGASAEKNILDYRSVLEPALLEAKLADGFNALERIARRRQLAAVVPPPPPPAGPPPGPGDREFIYFTFDITAGGFVVKDDSNHDADDEDIERLDLTATLFGSTAVPLWNRARDPAKLVLNPHGSFREPSRTNTFVAMLPAGRAPVKWKEIDAISLGVNFYVVDDVAFTHIRITARDVGGADEVLVDKDFGEGHLILAHQSDSVVLLTRRPPGSPPAPERSAEELEDEVKRAALLAHFSDHNAHYARVLALHQNPIERARQLDTIKLPDGSTVLDHVENRPLEVIGDYLAYPCSDSAWADRVRDVLERGAPPESPWDERLITLPTRGIFAEAKLGHCNASEEIDNTRFWDWQRSPIPHFAPEIAPVQPVTPQPQQQDLTPTPFPSSLVNIVNPPNAPDPTGMSAALAAISTPNIFRDMSGRAELASLWEKLSDNAVSMAQAGGMARSILSKQAASAAGSGAGIPGATSPDGGSGSAAGGGTMPPSEQLDRMQVVRNAVEHGNISPESGNQKIEKILEPGDQASSGEVRLSNNSAEARAFFPPDNLLGETVLIAEVGGMALKNYVWLPLPQSDGGSVELDDISETVTKVFAKRPGRCVAEFKVSLTQPSAPTEATELSVPIFVEIAGTGAEVSAALSSWGLAGREAVFLGEIKSIVRELAAVGNFRFVWTIALAGSTPSSLPPRFAPGGSAAEFLTRISLGGTSASGNFIDAESSAVFPDTLDFKGTAALNLDRLIAGTEAVGASFGSLIAPPPAPGVEAFALRFVSRALASYIVRVACGLIFGSSSASTPPTFQELTGFEIAPAADPGDPASYTDRGVGAMQLRSSTVNVLEERFPVPPAFR